MQSQPTDSERIRVWIDADACPRAIRDILIRAMKRGKVELIFVANALQQTDSPWMQWIAVRHGADIADNEIVRQVQAGEIVITADIPLAARVVEKSAIAIGSRGELWDENSVHQRLATRNLMEQMRAAGMETSGPKAQSGKDVQAFSNQFDRIVTRLRRKRSKS